MDEDSEDDNYMPLSEDEESLDDDKFIMPEDPVEQERFKRWLIATAKSLKKKQQQLQADQDLLTDRWTEVLAAEEYGLERTTKKYPKRRLLPQLEEEALKPTLPARDAADGPPRGRDKVAYQPEVQTAPRRQSNDNTKARSYTKDLRDVLENKAGQSRSIYGSQGMPQHATMSTTPDTLNTNPSRPNTADQIHPNRVAT